MILPALGLVMGGTPVVLALALLWKFAARKLARRQTSDMTSVALAWFAFVLSALAINYPIDFGTIATMSVLYLIPACFAYAVLRAARKLSGEAVGGDRA